MEVGDHTSTGKFLILPLETNQGYRRLSFIVISSKNEKPRKLVRENEFFVFSSPKERLVKVADSGF